MTPVKTYRAMSQKSDARKTFARFDREVDNIGLDPVEKADLISGRRFLPANSKFTTDRIN